MTKTQSRDAARLDARYIRNLCAAADLLDALAESGMAEDPDAVHDIAGHLRNAGMFTPNTTMEELRAAQKQLTFLCTVAKDPSPEPFTHSRQ